MINLIKYVVYSNVWIALGAAFFTLNYYFISKSSINYNVLGFVFCATLFTYTFQRLVKIKLKINTLGDRVEWMNQNKILVIITLILSVFGSFYFGVQFLENVWLLFGMSGLLSFFYVWKIPGLNGKNLRDVPGIKIYIIAIVWVMICVLVPFLISPKMGYTELIFLILSELLFMISITIPFDIRDINLDEDSKKTIPQLIGVKKSVLISILLLISSQILLFFVLDEFNLGIILMGLIGSVTLFYAHPNRQELYFSGIIDALLIVQPLLLISLQ